MPIAKWTRISETTERHLPTGVEIVKIPARTPTNPTSRIRWEVRHPAPNGTRHSWTKATRNEAKAIAERLNIPGMITRRDEAHTEALDEDGARVVLAEAVEVGLTHPGAQLSKARVQAYREALHGDPHRFDLAASHRYAMDVMHAAAIAEDGPRMARRAQWGPGDGPRCGVAPASLARAHEQALTEDAYRTELRAELIKFAAGADPYPYIRINEGEPTSYITLIDRAHTEALAEEAAYAQNRTHLHRTQWQATVDADHAEALAAVAPQLHPEDTPRWDPQRQLAGTAPISDAGLSVAVMHDGDVSMVSVRMILARLRRAELELAAARAELIRRDAEQVLSLSRAAAPYPTTH